MASTEGRTAAAIELWGGIECTVNRVGDRYHDQLDADRSRTSGSTTCDASPRWAFDGCAIRCCGSGSRRTARAGADWRWTDARSAQLRDARHRADRRAASTTAAARVYRRCSIRTFREQLAAYARRVAERYPWVDAYTPINEPLTTARFCGLYGHWYPHARDPTRVRQRAAEPDAERRVLAMRADARGQPDPRSWCRPTMRARPFSTRALA